MITFRLIPGVVTLKGAGGHHNHKPGIPGPVDAFYQSRILAHPSLSIGAHGNIHDPDPQPVLPVQDPADPGQNVGGRAVPLPVQDLDSRQGTAWGHALVPSVGNGPAAPDDPADMGPMAAVIIGTGPVVHHIRKARDPVLKIPVGICPCIQHRHADAPPRKPQGIGVPAADLFLYTIHI